MPKVLIVVDEESDGLGKALKQAILAPSVTPQTQGSDATESLFLCQYEIEIQTIARLQPDFPNGKNSLEETILCPLTFKLPPSLAFAQQKVYRACEDVVGLRQRVEIALCVPTDSGKLWLPIVLTAKGPLYGEVITSVDSRCYCQPLHLPDRYRQPLYKLGQRLLKLVSATPSTYLMQFGFAGETVFFDRLFPFPAAPAIASLKIQSPDLFACHWHCLTNTPILDLTIAQGSDYQVFQPSLSDL